MKQALGLAVSGTEVRLAHLINHNGQIRIQGLERARLKSTLENRPAPSETNQLEDTEAKDAFGLKDALGEKENGAAEQKSDNGNLEILYRLLEKYTQKKTKIAFNIPLSMATYERQEGAAGRSEGIDTESSLGQALIKAQDGSMLRMSYEKHPPTMTLMREVNEFLRGNLFLALMDSTEVALANLARRSSELEAGKVTAIVYIEDDFTRLLFLRGKDLFHVSSVLHENMASPDILEVIYRKLIYEQDEAGIPEIAAIWLTGKSNRIHAADFFAEHFESVKVCYLSADMVSGLLSSEAQAGNFSEFAVPIALAWKTLEPQSPFFIPTNLLPQELLDQQQVLKLSYHGWVLLGLTGLVAFFFTWQVLRQHDNISETRAKNTQLEMQIANNQSTVDRVMQLENECQRLRKSAELADSLSRGHDEFLAFLQKLNKSMGRAGNVWVDQIDKSKDGFSVKGTALSREAIPMLAEKLENASLRQVTRLEAEGASRKAFGFDLERQSAPAQVQLSGQGFSTIDEARYTSNGSLILGKGSSPANTNNVSPLPGVTNGTVSPRPANTPQVPFSTLNGKSEKREPTTQNSTPLASNTRQAAAKPQVSVPLPPNKGKETATAQKPAPEVPKSQVEQKAPNLATGTAKRESNVSTVAENFNERAASPPAPKSTNGLAANSGERGASGATERVIDTPPAPAQISKPALPKTLGEPGPETAQPAPVVPKPVEKQPEIYRGYTIEAATSYTRDLAEQFAAAYRKQGYDAAVEPYLDERNGAKKFRVLIGAFSSRPAAEQKAAQMAGILMKDYRVVGLK